MNYIIRIKECGAKDFGYIHEKYLKGISTDEYGHIELSFTTDPESAKRYRMTRMEFNT